MWQEHAKSSNPFSQILWDACENKIVIISQFVRYGGKQSSIAINNIFRAGFDLDSNERAVGSANNCINCVVVNKRNINIQTFF